MRYPQFVEEAISKLLLNDCIQEHCEPPYIVNPLSVTEAKKLRLVIDRRHVNPCLFKRSLSTRICIAFLKCLNRTFVFFLLLFFFTWDPESGYNHIDIFNEHQIFWGVSWPFCGKLRFFSFKILPFGLSSACFCFAKLLREPLLLSFLTRRDLRTPREGLCVCGQLIASEGFGAGWFETEHREIYVRANASR